MDRTVECDRVRGCSLVVLDRAGARRIVQGLQSALCARLDGVRGATLVGVRLRLLGRLLSRACFDLLIETAGEGRVGQCQGLGLFRDRGLDDMVVFQEIADILRLFAVRNFLSSNLVKSGMPAAGSPSMARSDPSTSFRPLLSSYSGGAHGAGALDIGLSFST